MALENLECRLVPAVNFSTSGNTILLKEADPLGMGSGDAGQGDGKDNLDLKVVSNQLWYQWTAPDRVGGSRSSGWSNTGWNVSAATGAYTIQIKVSGDVSFMGDPIALQGSSLVIDGKGTYEISTGIRFFDHMLDQIVRHGLIDLEIIAKGDLHIDAHHTVEDVGITLGQAFAKAVGDKKGLRRYGHAYVPLDEALSRVVVDLSGRPGLEYNIDFTRARIGDFDVAAMNPPPRTRAP